MPIIEFSGILHEKGETQYLGKNESFIKRQIVIEESNPGNDGKVYTELIPCQLIGADKAKAVDSFAVMDRVMMKVAVSGRPWDPPDGGARKYFLEFRVLAMYPAEDDGYGNRESGDDPESIFINPNNLTHEDILLDLEKKGEATKPEEKSLFGEEPESDLPFALMIPLAIGFLTQFLIL